MSTSDLWEYRETTLKTGTWKRSWRQEFYTEYGTAFYVVCHMEEVTCDENGKLVSRKDLGKVTRNITELMQSPHIANVMQLSSILTELVGAWYLEDQTALLNQEVQVEAPSQPSV